MMVFLCHVKDDYPVCLFRGLVSDICLYCPPGACLFEDLWVTEMRRFVDTLDAKKRNALVQILENMEDNDGNTQ